VQPSRKRLVYISLAATLVVLFCVGVIAGYLERHNSLCPDDKPPVAQQDTGLGEVLFRCHNGETVTSNN
jgi:hypothetical protein